MVKWFTLLRRIKNGHDHKGSNDISESLRSEIERHFRYFWEHNRNRVLIANPKYFNSIPFVLKEKILCGFMFQDILNKTAFQTFILVGREFDDTFVYELSFGFMPREYFDEP